MDIKTTIYKSLEWYIIKETSKEKLLFLKDSFTDEMIQDVFDRYDSAFDVQFNPDYKKIWWEESYIREVLNSVFLKRYLDAKDLNMMSTALKLNGAQRTTEDYVRLITKEEVESLSIEILKTIREYGYWTMTPYKFFGSTASMFFVGGSSYPGRLSNYFVHGSVAVRPVVSLKSDNLISDQNSSLINKPNEKRERMRRKLEKLRNL